MAKSWTCGRCAASNEEAAVSCQSCGLIRGGVVTAPNPVMPPPQGSTPPPAAPPDWSAPASSAMAPGGWLGAPVAQPAPGAKQQVAKGFLANIGVRVVLLVVIAAVGGGIAWLANAGRDSNGQIDKAGELKPADLRVGDCFDLPGDSSSFDPNATIEKTTAMKCTEAHHYEVFYTGTLTDSGSYPTEADLQSAVSADCSPAFEAYVGTSVDQSSLTIYYFVPDDAAWSGGDRALQCSLADPSLKAFSKSLKGSGY